VRRRKRAPAPPPCRDVAITRHQTRIHSIRLSGLPLTCGRSDGACGPWVFPELHTSGHRVTVLGQGASPSRSRASRRGRGVRSPHRRGFVTCDFVFPRSGNRNQFSDRFFRAHMGRSPDFHRPGVMARMRVDGKNVILIPVEDREMASELCFCEPPVRIELTTFRLQGDQSPVWRCPHVFAYARQLRKYIRVSSVLFAPIRGS
jgi:hypothetical protein